jgi:His-Xaa-Ser system protein HxsD
MSVDLAVYPLAVVMRACHAFTARCHVSIRRVDAGTAIVELSLNDIRGEFSNALLDAHLRALIAAETKTIRELLVAQAFCEADLLDRREIESNEDDDPRGVAR